MCVISAENGVEDFITTKNHINSNHIVDLVLKIQEKKPNITVFADNASYNKSRRTKEALKENGVNIVYNVPYTPILNPIEQFFLVVKTEYKKQRLKFLLRKRKMDTMRMIRNIIEQVEPRIPMS